MVELSLIKKSTYQYRWKVSNNDTLPYRIMYPFNFDPSKKYPVVLFLHGAGERGNDNERQLTHGAKLFQDSIHSYQAIYILPQCKVDSYWANVDVNRAPGNNIFTFRDDAHPTEDLGNVIDVLNKTIRLPFIDERRIYVGGLSMGGMGTWEMLWRLPNTFAAATPICGGGMESKASMMVHVPIWTFHGAIDNVVSLKYSQQMVDALYLNGGIPKFTVYPGVGHDSWTVAFAEKDFLKWIFDQRKD
jgi:predicted peptidase